MKFLIVIVGLIAVGNATTFVRFADPAIIPSVVSPYAPYVAPVVRSIVPAVVPPTELADWEAYKVKLKFIQTTQLTFVLNHWKIPFVYFRPNSENHTLVLRIVTAAMFTMQPNKKLPNTMNSSDSVSKRKNWN